MTRDFQRGRVYKAEAILEGGTPMRTMAEVRAFVDRVTGSAVFRRRWGKVYIRLEDGRGRRSASAWGNADSIGAPVIALPRWARLKPYILHEIAHTVSDEGVHHGPEFCRVYLEMVRLFMGPIAANVLRQSFRESRVRVAPRSKIIEAPMAARRRDGR